MRSAWLAIGLIYFFLRYIAGRRYGIRSAKRSGCERFWDYNTGLALWIGLNFFPIGWPQLNAVFEHGYAYARSVTSYAA